MCRYPAWRCRLRYSGSRSLLVRLAPIATGDPIEMECSAKIQNTHLDLGRELGGVAAKLRHGVGEQCGLQTS